jgi:hypothetical protein
MAVAGSHPLFSRLRCSDRKEAFFMDKNSADSSRKSHLFKSGRKGLLFSLAGLFSIVAVSFSLAIGQAAWTFANGSVDSKQTAINASLAPWQFARSSYAFNANEDYGGYYDNSTTKAANFAGNGDFYDESAGWGIPFFGYYDPAKRNDHYKISSFPSGLTSFGHTTLVMPWTGYNSGLNLGSWSYESKPGAPIYEIFGLSVSPFNDSTLKQLVLPLFYYVVGTYAFSGIHNLEIVSFNSRGSTLTYTSALSELSDKAGLTGNYKKYNDRFEYYDGSEYSSHLVTIGSHAFYNDGLLQYVDLPANLGSIGGAAFACDPTDTSHQVAPVLQLNYPGSTSALLSKIAASCFTGRRRVILTNTTNSSDRLVMDATNSVYSNYFA